MDFSLTTIVIWAVPILFAITLHEAAHGYVARLFGDPTAHQAGRITLNPIKHIDPVGTILVPGLIIAGNALTGAQFPPFGWAKPVPVDFGRLRQPKKDMLWVAAAGPAANLVQAIFWMILVGIAVRQANQVIPGDSNAWPYLFQMAKIGIDVNLALMLLNLLPIPPLDGGRILVSVLPSRQAYAVSRVEPYGFFILIGLLYFNVLDVILWPLIGPLRSALSVFAFL